MHSFPKLKGPAILAPMTGVTDVAFRALCRRYGASMSYTEFVSSAGLSRKNKKSERLLTTDPIERPIGVQLFGADEAEIVKSAKMVEERFDVIDMNCGCPAFKVIKTGAGSALLSDPEKIGRLIKRVVRVVDKPVTIKIRAGIDKNHINAVEIAKIAEKMGVAAITVHGRTQKQGYSGKADWEIIKAVKESVSIPIIGNGDVFSAEEFWRHKEESGCDYIMIGRGAIGNPLIFKEIKEYKRKLEDEDKDREKGNIKKEDKKKEDKKKEEKRRLFIEYCELAEKYDITISQIKNHALSFTKGLKKSAQIRNKMTAVKSVEELINLFKDLGE